MDSRWTIRSATIDDARAIAAVHVSSWQTAYRGIVPETYLDALSIEAQVHHWQASLSGQAADIWVATDGDALRGWINIGNSRDDDAGANTGELWAIYVDPHHYGQGVGRALWAHAARELRARKYEHVTLWVLERNHAARAFYAKLGFEVEPSRRKTIELGGAALGKVRLQRSLLLPAARPTKPHRP